MQTFSHVTWTAVCLLVVAWLGCTPAEVKSTQVIVRIDGGPAVQRLAELRIAIYATDATRVEDAVELRPFALVERAPREGQVTLPFSFAIARGRDDRFLIVVSGYPPGRASEALIEQKAIVSFRERRTELLSLYLSDTCLERVCASLDQTCRTDVAAAGCGSVPSLETAPLRPGDELSPLGPTAELDAAGPRAGEDAGVRKGDPDAASSTDAAAEAAGPIISLPDGGETDATASPDASAPVGDDCSRNPSRPGCAVRCGTSNACSAPEYPCVDLAAGGYTCLGQLADWPIPEVRGDAKHPAKYDLTSVPGVVVDEVTKLAWQRTPPESLRGCSAEGVSGGPPRNVGYACTHAEARRYCEDLQLAGMVDWRLPSVIEALTLGDDTQVGPAIDPLFYRSYVERESAWLPIWTTSTAADGSDSAWVVEFTSMPAHYKRLRSDLLRVRCVRGTPSGTAEAPYTPAQRYRIDEVARGVTDTRTGLTWEQPIVREQKTLTEANRHCEALAPGYRLPTRKELLSLVDFTREGPAITAVFSGTPALQHMTGEYDWFWTSTPWQPGAVVPQSACTATSCFHTVRFADGRSDLASPSMVDGYPARGYVRCVQ